MAVNALHSFREVNVLEMNGAFEVRMRDDVVVQIEPVPLAILLENSAKYPAVPVVIRKLRML